MKQIMIAFLLVAAMCKNASAQDNLISDNKTHTILSFSPVQMSTFTPTGFGIQLERFLNHSDKWSFYLPFAYTFGNSDPCDPAIKAHVFYAYPGIKFYPVGSHHIVAWSVGTSLAAGKGETNCNCDQSSSPVTDIKATAYRPIEEFGLILNNAVNVQAGKNIYIGAEFGIGSSFVYIDNGNNMPNDVILQANIKIGYCF